MSSDVVISCRSVGKAFQLYTHYNDQLKQALLGFDRPPVLGELVQ